MSEYTCLGDLLKAHMALSAALGRPGRRAAWYIDRLAHELAWSPEGCRARNLALAHALRAIYLLCDHYAPENVEFERVLEIAEAHPLACGRTRA